MCDFHDLMCLSLVPLYIVSESFLPLIKESSIKDRPHHVDLLAGLQHIRDMNCSIFDIQF